MSIKRTRKMRFVQPAHGAGRVRGSSARRADALDPPTSRAQLAKVLSVDEARGDVRLRWLTTTDLGAAEFTIRANQWFAAPGGRHWLGGLPMPGDDVYVDAVIQHRGSGKARTAYRFQSAGVDRTYARDVRLGRIPRMAAGDKLVRSGGGAQAWLDSGGNVRIESGFRSPQEQEYAARIEASDGTWDHSIPQYRDHLSILASEVAGDRTPVRALLSEVGSTVVQWGKLSRISRHTDAQVVDRIDENASEFRASVTDPERREDWITTFVGHGMRQDGTPILTRVDGTRAVAGFLMSVPVTDRTIGASILIDEFGGFEASDDFGNHLRTHRGRVSLKSTGRMSIRAADSISSRVDGSWSVRARSGSETFHNLERTVGGDSYVETILAEHRITRGSTFEDVASATGTTTPQYRWAIEPSPVSQILMKVDSIEFGNDASSSNVVLMANSGTLGKDHVIGRIRYDLTSTTIGNSSAQGIMEVKAAGTSVGTGSPIDVDLAATRNKIGHSIFNWLSAPVNYLSEQVFIGTSPPGTPGIPSVATEPIVKGIQYSALLSSILAELQVLSGAVTTLATSHATHVHPGPGIPSPDAAAVGPVVASTSTGVQSSLGTSQGQIPSTLSTRGFTS